MQSAGEVLTLQFGQYANYCGTHYWNLQDESLHNKANSNYYNKEAFFRAGELRSGARTYTPRLLCFDFKANFGSLSKCGTINSDATGTTPSVGGSVKRIERDAPQKHSFVQALETQQQSSAASELQHTTSVSASPSYDFENTVLYWSDFLNVDLNSKTVHDVSHVAEWSSQRDRFALGHLALGTIDRKDEALEAVRVYTEECGLLQGFQTVVDFSSPGFSSFASDYITELRDEYPKKDVLLFAVSPTRSSSSITLNREQLTSRIAGDALSLYSLVEHADLFVPLSLGSTTTNLPHIRPNVNKMYHSSAILATAIEALTSPCRLFDASAGLSLSGFCNALHRGSKRKLVSAMLSMPLPQLQRFFSETTFQSIRQRFLQPLNAYYETPAVPLYQSYSQLAVLKGVDEALWKANGIATKATGQSQSLSQWFSGTVATSGYSKTFTLNRPVDLPITYPQFFNAEVRQNGLIASGEPTEVHSIPLLATAENSDYVHGGLAKVVNSFRSLERQQVFQLQAPDMNVDEYNEVVHQLLNVVEQFEE